jgi:hypothetical protein
MPTMRGEDIGDDSEAWGVVSTPAPYPASATAAWWDEADRPSLPPSPAAAHHSALGRAVGQHLVDVHDHLRGELMQLQDLVNQLRAGAVEASTARDFVNQMTIRQNSWTVGAYCASYCRILTQHHGMEDQAIFPHLRSREPTLGPVLDRLAEEHHVIHGVLETLDRAFVAFLADPESDAPIDAAMQALDKTLLSHLAYEESQLVEPLARHGFYRGQLP